MKFLSAINWPAGRGFYDKAQSGIKKSRYNALLDKHPQYVIFARPMDDAISVRGDITIPPSEIWMTASRSGGPGGQHVNTTSSRVSLHWNIRATNALSPMQKNQVLHRLANRISTEGVLTVTVDSERSQHTNRQIAKERLADMIRNALIRPKKRIPTKTTKGAKERRLNAKSQRSAVKRLRSKPRDDE